MVLVTHRPSCVLYLVQNIVFKAFEEPMMVLIILVMAMVLVGVCQ